MYVCITGVDNPQLLDLVVHTVPAQVCVFMCVYVSVCVCVYIYIYIYIYIYMHVRALMYMHASVYF